MAQVILYEPLNMNDFPFAVGETSYPIVTSTHIRELADNSVANYYGTGLTVSGVGNVTGGILTGANYSEGGVLQFSVTGLNRNAALIWDYIVAEDTSGLLGYALSGADIITGSGGDDYIYSYGGNDVVSGGDGNDVVVGGLGVDRLNGGGRHDTVFGESGNDIVTGGDGNDGLFGDLGNDILKGGADNDFLGGGAGADILKGGTGDDILAGEGTADQMKGQAGNDILGGGGGKDRLEGNAGDDILNGEKGNDILIGGDGVDWFWFEETLGAKNVDVIEDFTGAGSASEDSIRLDADLFTQLPVGALEAGNFLSGSAIAAAEADDFILYDSATGALYYDADGNGPGEAIQFATLTGSPDALDHTDFEVV